MTCIRISFDLLKRSRKRASAIYKSEYLLALISIGILVSGLLIRVFLTFSPTVKLFVTTIYGALLAVAGVFLVKVCMFVRMPIRSFIASGKHRPLAENERPQVFEEIKAVGRALGVKNLHIYVTDEQVYSFSGVHRSDRIIVLCSDFLRLLSNEELRAVLLHELCHLRTDARVAALATTSYRKLIVPLFLIVCCIFTLEAALGSVVPFGMILLFGTAFGMFGFRPSESGHVFFQQREMYADCFSAIMMGEAGPLISALRLSLTLGLTEQFTRNIKIAPLLLFNPLAKKKGGQSELSGFTVPRWVDETTHPSIAERVRLLSLVDAIFNGKIAYRLVKPLGSFLDLKISSFRARKKPNVFQTSFGKHAASLDRTTYRGVKEILKEYNGRTFGYDEIHQSYEAKAPKKDRFHDTIIHRIRAGFGKIDKVLSSWDERQFGDWLTGFEYLSGLLSKLFLFDFFVVFYVLLAMHRLEIL